ncbi:hypothetical protein [Nostoc sp.]
MITFLTLHLKASFREHLQSQDRATTLRGIGSEFSLAYKKPFLAR